jgi:hypothetical protein
MTRTTSQAGVRGAPQGRLKVAGCVSARSKVADHQSASQAGARGAPAGAAPLAGCVSARSTRPQSRAARCAPHRADAPTCALDPSDLAGDNAPDVPGLTPRASGDRLAAGEAPWSPARRVCRGLRTHPDADRALTHPAKGAAPAGARRPPARAGVRGSRTIGRALTRPATLSRPFGARRTSSRFAVRPLLTTLLLLALAASPAFAQDAAPQTQPGSTAPPPASTTAEPPSAPPPGFAPPADAVGEPIPGEGVFLLCLFVALLGSILILGARRAKPPTPTT